MHGAAGCVIAGSLAHRAVFALIQISGRAAQLSPADCVDYALFTWHEKHPCGALCRWI
ncbi:MAG TPA: hypothetical protein VFL15_05565 [Gammaproteobacteria bacterium]|nr:hypothetical protein [Gammaproteobacteria bacterium]